MNPRLPFHLQRWGMFNEQSAKSVPVCNGRRGNLVLSARCTLALTLYGHPHDEGLSLAVSQSSKAYSDSTPPTKNGIAARRGSWATTHKITPNTFAITATIILSSLTGPVRFSTPLARLAPLRLLSQKDRAAFPHCSRHTSHHRGALSNRSLVPGTQRPSLVRYQLSMLRGLPLVSG
jgi:hypothetical protein